MCKSNNAKHSKTVLKIHCFTPKPILITNIYFKNISWNGAKTILIYTISVSYL